MTSSKKSSDLDYYFIIFWKILCSTALLQSFIARAYLVQDLWRWVLLSPPQVIQCQKSPGWLGLREGVFPYEGKISKFSPRFKCGNNVKA